MKQLLYAISIALMGTIAIISCKGTTSETNFTESGIPNFIGTWHHETMFQTRLGADSDSLFTDYINNPHEMQFYEVYTPDSLMTFYVIQNDTLINKIQFRYAFRNDTLYMSHPDKPVQTVHVKNFTDSIITTDYTRTFRNATFYCISTTRRSELPKWKIEK